MKIYVSHPTGFDFRNELYAPLRSSTLSKRHTILFPHEGEEFTDSSKSIKECDLVIAEVSIPSTGVGIELGWASSNKVPIICFYRKGSAPSKSLGFITKNMVEYSTPEDMVVGIEKALKRIRQERKIF